MTHARTQLTEVEVLKQSIGKTRDAYKDLEEWVSLLMNEVMVTSIHRFEEVKRHISLIWT